MTTIDIRETSTARAEVQGAPSWRRDPDDEDAVTVRLKVRLVLEGPDDARVWDETCFPGASRRYSRATEETSTEKWTDRYRNGMDLFVNWHEDPNGPTGGVAFAGGACRCTEAVLVLSKAAQHVDLTLEFGGITDRDLGGFLLASTKPADVRIQPAQLGLFKAAAA